ncbi:hypothetical protein FB451DRAFT_1402495 [Mycena latifolia]|nr:hypothetical protein FB451DRAFT_1402495 [Mycena latifolia]
MPASGADSSLQLSAAHPLMEELSSLRWAVAGFQHHALDTSAFSERVAYLDAENVRLRAELGVLRSSPLAPPSSSASAAEGVSTGDTMAALTLSLRRLSAKLTLTESSLFEHTLTLP